MKQPSLEEVKEYFKNAVSVYSCDEKHSSEIGYFENADPRGIHEWQEDFWIFDREKPGNVMIYNHKTEEYSKILTYKEKTFSITESQIKTLNYIFEVSEAYQGQDYLKEWFSEAFESEVKSIPDNFTGWAKDDRYEKWIAFFENGIIKYGLTLTGEWINYNKKEKSCDKNNREATEQEVFEALKNEAVKRGLVKDEFIFPIEDEFNEYGSFKENINRIGSILEIKNRKLYVLGYGKYCVFKDGQWAGIQQSITLSEAEQQLKKKIIV